MDRETAKLRGDEALISLHHCLLGGAYHPLKAAHAVERRLGISAGNRLRVLLFHDIAPEEEARLASQLRWLARSWSFVAPTRFEAMLAGEEPVIGKQLLVTFDDGFASNRALAERVLNPMRIRALFFRGVGFRRAGRLRGGEALHRSTRPAGESRR